MKLTVKNTLDIAGVHHNPNLVTLQQQYKQLNQQKKKKKSTFQKTLNQKTKKTNKN